MGLNRLESIRSDAAFAAHVTVSWENHVIAVRHVRSGETFDAAALAPGGPRVAPRLGRVHVHVPAGPAVHRTATVSRQIEGPADAVLAAGDQLEMRSGSLVVTVEAERESELAIGGLGSSGSSAGALAHVAAAAVLHAILLLSPASSALASSMDDDETTATERMRAALAHAEARSVTLETTIEDGAGEGQGKLVNARDGNGRSGGGHRAAGEEGRIGSVVSRSQQRRWAAPERVKDDPAPAVSRDQARQDAASFGMIGLLAQGSRAPASPWGDLETHGLDARGADGAMWARSIGESAGSAGLGLNGIGEGGGGDGAGIGLGTIGTIGHTDGAPGAGTGGRGSPLMFGIGSWGGSWGHGARFGHRTRAPRLRMGYAMVDGTLPAEVIQRIVRQNFGRFRVCYEKGLVSNPSLEGRVTTRFLIGGDGLVKATANAGSSLPNPEVVSCVVNAFGGLAFPEPAPAGATVTVTYPLMLAPQ